MKKQLLASAFLLVTLFTTAKAESKTEEMFKTFRFGLFIGPSFNSLRPVASAADNYIVEKTGSRMGLSFGICADYNLNERYTVYSGLGLDWRGGKINSQLPLNVPATTGYIRAAEVKYKTQYLTIPIGLKMTAATFDKIKIQALAGFDLGILLSQKGDYTFTTTVYDSVAKKYTTVSADNAKIGGIASVVPIGLGWNVGIGGEYDLNGKNAVTCQLIYRNGFVDATTPKTNKTGSRFSDGNVRSNSIDIRFGYTF
jgi:Outer membrane protein beta-barrel domain